ncbi:hypothetical protein ES703_41459 [subsurface metagenome]
MPILKNKRHEKFAINIFKSMSLHDAALGAGYSPKYIDQTASRLYRNVKILDRVQELHKMAESDAVMSQKEIEERLTEIGRARLVDFVDENGKITLKVANDGALREFVLTDWKGGKEERAESRTTKIKLHNPMTAMDMLNKMRGDYPPANVLQLEPGDTLGPMLVELLTKLRGYGNKDEE